MLNLETSMGCQRLTYHKTFSPLKVVYNDLNINPNTSLGDYRYGFQGQEKDDEVKGEGNSINYKYRMHDPRIGRFFAVDPLTAKYPHYTPYSFSGNKVIHAVELEGLEEALLNTGESIQTGPASDNSLIDKLDAAGAFEEDNYVTKWPGGEQGIAPVDITPGPTSVSDVAAPAMPNLSNIDLSINTENINTNKILATEPFTFTDPDAGRSNLDILLFGSNNVQGGLGAEAYLFGGGLQKGVKWTMAAIAGGSDVLSQAAHKGPREINVVQSFGATFGGRFRGGDFIGAATGATLDWRPFSSNVENRSLGFSWNRGQSANQILFNFGATYGIGQFNRLPQSYNIERATTTIFTTFMGQGVSGIIGGEEEQAK